MPNMNNWMMPASDSGITQESRALDAWKRINDNPAMVHSLVLRRSGVKQSAQTFRVEFSDSGREVSDARDNAKTYRIVATVFGVLHHPSIDDADIQVDDEFGIAGVRYRVLTVLPFAGEIQASVYRLE